ncbi:hypothetical protein DRN84_02135 [Candidatus Geothermarchaeota archaeon]|nr:MAG: hypothetical protein DRN87_05835 [Candidatus Geothermarchaeota archaeon]RLG62357.1 MAG: hypothetical protein DRN84_02135 [Candidatus Geothermarchaeota archaeon]HEW93091.1 hypothetical protein [Thermoprotei archaeon]
MPNTRYRKGYRFEVRVRKFLEGLGYKVFRSAGSKPLDLIAFSRDRIFFIECKVRVNRSTLKRSGSRIIELARGTNAKPLIAFRDENNKIRFYDPVENREYTIPYIRSIDKYI